MVVHVAERALAAQNVARAIVATDDERVLRAVRDAGCEAVMTSAEHKSGSDRLAEVARGLDGAEIIVNVQGDEPLIAPETIERAVDEMLKNEDASVVTTSEMMTDARDVLSADVVKVVTDASGRALYFSRAPIPFPREAVREHGSLAAALEREPSLIKLFSKHTGLYAYRRTFLLEYSAWPQSELEKTEALEQLRALERGAWIQVVETHLPSIGVDTAEDLARVRELFEAEARGEVRR